MIRKLSIGIRLPDDFGGHPQASSADYRLAAEALACLAETLRREADYADETGDSPLRELPVEDEAQNRLGVARYHRTTDPS